MTKEKAAERINEAIRTCRVSTCFEDVEAFGMALRALENMPEEDSLDSIKNANTQRYVVTVDLDKYMYSKIMPAKSKFDKGYNAGVDDCISGLRNLPTVEAIPREQLKKIMSIYDGTLVSMILAFSRVQELLED